MPRRPEAATVENRAALSTEFGRNYATWLFGEEAIASLPLITRGPNKGQPKGYVIWRRTTEAGYHVNAGGGVGKDVTVRAWIGEHMHSSESQPMLGQWLGREQGLCGSLGVLGPKARERDAQERARDAAEREQRYAELSAQNEAN
jgi:hypothetical protein